MRIGWLCTLFGVLLVHAANAATVNFLASGTFQDASALSGFVVIDTAAGVVTSGDLAVTGRPVHYTTLDLQRTWPLSSPFLYEVEFSNGQATDNTVTLLFPPVSLVGYTGGILCGITTACQDATLSYFSNISTHTAPGFSNFIELDSGSLTAAAPEPSTVAMFLSVIPAIAAWRQRRARYRRCPSSE